MVDPEERLDKYKGRQRIRRRGRGGGGVAGWGGGILGALTYVRVDVFLSQETRKLHKGSTGTIIF